MIDGWVKDDHKNDCRNTYENRALIIQEEAEYLIVRRYVSEILYIESK